MQKKLVQTVKPTNENIPVEYVTKENPPQSIYEFAQDTTQTQTKKYEIKTPISEDVIYHRPVYKYEIDVKKIEDVNDDILKEIL